MHLPSTTRTPAGISMRVGLCGAALLFLTTTAMSAPPPSTQPAVPPAGGFNLEPGPYEPAMVDLILKDPARGKEMPLKVRYPRQAPGPLPVLVFSHGRGGSGESFPKLANLLVSRGWVVLLPTHEDSVRLRQQRGLPATQPDVDEAQIMRRLGDVRLVVDSLTTIAQQTPALRDDKGQPRFDTGRIAVAGHSYGAYLAQMLIGARVQLEGRRELVDVSDPRFCAAIAISGAGATDRFLTPQAWDHVRKPVLFVAGSADTTRYTPDARDRIKPFQICPPGGKYLLYIDGATHLSYTGKRREDSVTNDKIPTVDAAWVEALTNSAAQAFLEAHVRQNPAAVEYLRKKEILTLAGAKSLFEGR